jgi:hypothetical protein
MDQNVQQGLNKQNVVKSMIAIPRNYIIIQVTTWMNLDSYYVKIKENTHKEPQILLSHLFEMFRIDKNIESRLVEAYF